MQEETSSNSTSGSYKEAMAVLGAFGELIDKVVTAKQTNSQEDANSNFRQSIRMIWAANKDTIKQEYAEVKHLDVEPEHGYLFVVIEDEAFDNISVSRLRSIKHYLYQSANHKMIFDNFTHFLNNNVDHRIVI